VKNNRQRSLRALAALAGAFGCEREPFRAAPSAPGPSVAPYVTGQAALALTPDGRVMLPDPRSPDGTPIISEERARQLAAAYIRTYGRFHLGKLEKQRGTKIGLASLRIAPRAYFAQTPYGPTPPGFHPMVRKSHGPYYILTLNDGGTPVVMLAVSAYNTDIGIGADGQLELPRYDGESFRHRGIPVASDRLLLPVSPEDAIARVAHASGRRVALVPELILPDAKTLPFFAVWKVTLDADVAVTRGAGRAAGFARELFVGPLGSRDFRLPAQQQPTENSGTAHTIDTSGHLGADAAFSVPVRRGFVVRYEAAVLEPEKH
jgi:hypothetical protein